MAVALGMGKSNAHRVLTTLAQLGYVVSQNDGRYQATLKTWEVGCAVLDRLDFKSLARPVMEALTDSTSESCHLAVLDGFDVVYLDKVEGNQPVRTYSRIGQRAPAHVVAIGKVLLAFQVGIAKRLPKMLARLTAQSICKRTDLLKELESVRVSGYAINRAEWLEGVCGIGAPIRNSRNEVICAIGLSGPCSRLSRDKLHALAPQVVESAQTISFQLGYRPSSVNSIATGALSGEIHTKNTKNVTRRPAAKRTRMR